MTRFAGHAPRPADAGPIPDLTIREAAAADLPSLARIAAEREGDGEERHRAAFEVFVRDVISGGDGLLIVAEHGRELLGFGKVARFRHASVGPGPAGPVPAASVPAASGAPAPTAELHRKLTGGQTHSLRSELTKRRIDCPRGQFEPDLRR